jgi:ubiquinone/menaquinone biosynthesis C-methylase UbiE
VFPELLTPRKEIHFMILPDPAFLKQTNSLDYFHWNYQFPIKYIQRFRFQAILKMLGQQPVESILEVGTGSGIFLPELSRHCRDLHACDVHNNMGAVEEMCRLTGTKATLRTCPLENTGYPDAKFDIVIAVSVLEFVDDLDQSLREIQRILKPGGNFLAICPHKSETLDYVLSFYSRRKPEEEFGDARSKVCPSLEKNFKVIEKRVFPGIIGRVLPVYNYYKLGRTATV